MATKNNPGKFDCYEAADPDEPLFVLRSTDPIAPDMVAVWGLLRGGYYAAAGVAFQRMLLIAQSRGPKKDDKCDEALSCAEDMTLWRAKNAS